MFTALIVLIFVGTALIAWSSARASAEQARFAAAELCARAGVQLLDQTVALRRVRLARGDDGRIGLRRHFTFEFSPDGVARLRGALDLVGVEVQGATLPLPATVNQATG